MPARRTRNRRPTTDNRPSRLRSCGARGAAHNRRYEAYGHQQVEADREQDRSSSPVRSRSSPTARPSFATATRWCSPLVMAAPRRSISSRSRSTSKADVRRGRCSSFFRREGRPSETAILTARLIDRPLRPSFREGYRDEVQVVITVLSVDMENQYDIPAMNAASLAVGIAGLPFDGPVEVRPSGAVGADWVVNPSFQELEEATFDIVVAGSKNEQGGHRHPDDRGRRPTRPGRSSPPAKAPPRPPRRSSRKASSGQGRPVIGLQEEFLAEVGVKPWTSSRTALSAGPLGRARVVREGQGAHRPRLRSEGARGEHVRRQGRGEGPLAQTAGKDVFAARASEFSPAWKARRRSCRPGVISDGIRLDGRGPKDIRPLAAHVGLLPRARVVAVRAR